MHIITQTIQTCMQINLLGTYFFTQQQQRHQQKTKQKNEIPHLSLIFFFSIKFEMNIKKSLKYVIYLSLFQSY